MRTSRPARPAAAPSCELPGGLPGLPLLAVKAGRQAGRQTSGSSQAGATVAARHALVCVLCWLPLAWMNLFCTMNPVEMHSRCVGGTIGVRVERSRLTSAPVHEAWHKSGSGSLGVLRSCKLCHVLLAPSGHRARQGCPLHCTLSLWQVYNSGRSFSRGTSSTLPAREKFLDLAALAALFRTWQPREVGNTLPMAGLSPNEQRQALLGGSEAAGGDAEAGGWAAVPAAPPREGPSVAELVRSSPDNVISTLQRSGVQLVAEFSLPVRALDKTAAPPAMWRCRHRTQRPSICKFLPPRCMLP